MRLSAIFVLFLALASFLAAQSNTTFAGLRFTTYAGIAPGDVDGTGSAARFNYPMGMAADSAGNLYVADSCNHTIRKVTPAGVTTTVAGTPGLSGNEDGPVAQARFYLPGGVAFDTAGNLYVADSGNGSVRMISSNGTVSTLASGLNDPVALTVDASALQPGGCRSFRLSPRTKRSRPAQTRHCRLWSPAALGLPTNGAKTEPPSTEQPVPLWPFQMLSQPPPARTPSSSATLLVLSPAPRPP